MYGTKEPEDAHMKTLFCVLGVALQTILDVYNCLTCIVSLYRNDPTPRKIDR
jgi:hypothetical protein